MAIQTDGIQLHDDKVIPPTSLNVELYENIYSAISKLINDSRK